MQETVTKTNKVIYSYVLDILYLSCKAYIIVQFFYAKCNKTNIK